MTELKKLAKETAIYGLSSIIGKFLNFLLVPLYSYVLVNSGDYGIVTNLYAWTALLMVILTYGMETGFFRFINKQAPEERKDNKVYSTTLTSVGSTSIIFAILCIALSTPIANAMGYPGHAEYIAMLGVVVALDAFGSIPFAYLRYQNRPIRFAILKLLMIGINILFNLFFLIICPQIHESNPSLISWFYDPGYGVGYIFVSNLISTICVTLALLPYVFVGKFNFNWALLRQMLRYSTPLMLLGIAGIMNQTIDKIIFPMIYPDPTEAMAQLGIYGACFKIAMIMMMFTYAFRFAYEPFIFSKHKDADSKEAYADAMKYFVITSLIIFLGMVMYLDIFKYIIGPEYRSGLRVVPIVLMAYLFQGIFYNLSLWYKLIDKTIYGAYFSTLGFVITLILNILFVPKFGYMASAWSSLVCFIIIAIISYFYGQKRYPITYDLKTIGKYFVVTLAFFFVSQVIPVNNQILSLGINTILFGLYLLYIIKDDPALASMARRFIKR